MVAAAAAEVGVAEGVVVDATGVVGTMTRWSLDGLRDRRGRGLI